MSRDESSWTISEEETWKVTLQLSALVELFFEKAILDAMGIGKHESGG